MLYIERDENGGIIAIFNSPQTNAREEKQGVDEEVLEFLSRTTSDSPGKLLLSQTDKGMIRLIEDLIDLLIAKELILYTELPEQAQKKIQERSRLRKTVTPQTLTVEDIL